MAPPAAAAPAFLIWVKAWPAFRLIMTTLQKGGDSMTVGGIVFLVAVVAAMVGFAGVLMWAERRTRR